MFQRIRDVRDYNLAKLNLSNCDLYQFPQEIAELKNLTKLDLSENKLGRLSSEIGELKNLTELNLSSNGLMQLPPELKELKKLEILNLSDNKLVNLPPEIAELKNLTTLDISENKLGRLSSEIGKLKNLTELNLSSNGLMQLPPDIKELKNLNTLYLYNNRFMQFPQEITELKNLTNLDLFGNQLTYLSSNISELKNLIELNLSENHLLELPPGIGELKKLQSLYLVNNQLSELPPEIGELENLNSLSLTGNRLISPPPEIVSRGKEAILTYLKQTNEGTIENNEAKLILVGNGDVGKTCLAYRLINGKFLDEAKITEGINISKWNIPAPESGHSKIKLNVWDFGGQEIYHSTHQFFLTNRSVYLLVWNARKTKDYDHIYYWLHTIEAFGEDSPIIIVMSKKNESDDDLNLKDLKEEFPQISGYLKIDSKDGIGISVLQEKIRETAWSLPLMRVRWANSWYKVRQTLEKLPEYWITHDKFYRICVSERLDDKNINVLDQYLHDLGVTLHFKDKIGLKNIVILKPEWATNSFYKILSTKSVLDNEGILQQSDLSKIWNIETYPSFVHSQLMELMNKFELAYELPEKNSYLIPELLPKSAPDFKWDDEDNLQFYYCYDHFLPHGVITRFIVRMHQDIEIKENRMPLCWREGVVLNFQNSRALVKMKPDERQIEIRIKGNNKRWALGAICSQIDHINASIRKISVTKQIPCNCSENCPQRYLYEDLLKAEIANVEKLLCYKRLNLISVPLLLDGYRRREERFGEYDELPYKPIVLINKVTSYAEASPSIKIEQKTDVNININIDLKIDLPQILTEFDELKEAVENINLKLDSEMDKIQDSLDELSTNSDKEKVAKPFNKLYRLLDKLSDPNSDYNKVITGTQKGIELAQKVGRTYNKFAQWLAMPHVPDLLLGK